MTAARLTAALADRYRIEREIGQGGMATVYLAADIKHKRKVALKVLKPELAALIGADRFLQEITTTAALQHPHILPLFDSGTADGFLYFVMPFIDGETLRNKLDRERQLGIEEAVKIATSVADALDYAHRQGVIHRDIKPENILLHEGRPMVADFGIALAVSAAAGGRMTETGLSMGTPHYMSPEQATAEREITARSDLYSLGSVLYEMLTGTPPHTGASAQQVISKIVTEDAVPVTKHRKNVPHNVAAAVAKALEKLPADRFESASAFAAALNDTHYSSAPKRADSVAVLQRHGTWVGVFSVAATAAAFLVGSWALNEFASASASSTSSASSAIYRFDISEPAGFTPAGISPWILPDGSGFSMLADGPDGRGVVVHRFDGSPTKFFPAPSASIGGWVLPDQSGIMYYAFPGGTASQLQLLSFFGAPPRVLTDSLRFGLALDREERIYGTHLINGGLTRVDSDGQVVDILTRPDTSLAEIAHWFPEVILDGEALVFHISYRDARADRLAFLDLRRRVVHRSVEGSYARLLPNGYLVYARGSVLHAGPIHRSGLEFSGTPTPVLRGVEESTRGGFSVSRTGALLYRRVPDSTWQLRESGDAARAAVITAAGKPVGAIRLRPTGKELLTLEGERDLWVRSSAGVARRLSAPDLPHRLAGWSTDGKEIMYVEFDGDPSFIYSVARGTLVTMHADGGAPEKVGRGTGDRVREADWGRGGIAYATMDGTIWWLADGASQPAEVARSVGGTGRLSGTTPTLSPDGHFIAYRARNNAVTVRAVPPATGVWEVSPGLNPRWSPDGKYLYFDQVRSPYQTSALSVARVPVTMGATFSFGKPELAATPPVDATLLWEVGPGNVVHWVTQKKSRESVLVLNWAREVDSLVRAASGVQRD